MTHPIIKTDNYILITSDDEIKEGDIYIQGYGVYSNIVFGKFTILSTLIGSNPDVVKNHCKKIIAHLPLNNSPILEGVPLLPPLPNDEDDIDKLAELNGHPESSQFYDYKEGFIDGFLEAKEKYKFTEEEVIKAIKMTRGSDIPIETIIQSLSQPKLPVGFKCEMELNPVNHAAGLKLTGNLIMDISITQNYTPKITNGVMQGEWIFE